jgi:hypothetical protein
VSGFPNNRTTEAKLPIPVIFDIRENISVLYFTMSVPEMKERKL